MIIDYLFAFMRNVMGLTIQYRLPNAFTISLNDIARQVIEGRNQIPVNLSDEYDEETGERIPIYKSSLQKGGLGSWTPDVMELKFEHWGLDYNRIKQVTEKYNQETSEEDQIWRKLGDKPGHSHLAY